MRETPDNNDNIENQHQQLESSIDNLELTETRDNQQELENENNNKAIYMDDYD